MPAGEGDGVHGSLEGALSAWRSVREDIVTCPPLLLNVWRCQGPYRRAEHGHHGGYRSVTSESDNKPRPPVSWWTPAAGAGAPDLARLPPTTRSSPCRGSRRRARAGPHRTR